MNKQEVFDDVLTHFYKLMMAIVYETSKDVHRDSKKAMATVQEMKKRYEEAE